MTRYKPRFQLLCLWTLCLMSSIKCQQMATCLVVTDAELDGLFAMALISRAELFEKSCNGELHIAVAMPDPDKLLHLRRVLRHLRLEIYNGMEFKRTEKYEVKPRTKKDEARFTQASTAIERILEQSKDIRILVIGPGTDLAHAIKKFSDSKKLNNIKEIVWAAGHEQEDEDVAISRNLNLDVQAVQDILAHESLRGKIKMVSLNHKSAYYSDITTDGFKELYQTLSRFDKDHPMQFVHDMSVMYVDDREGSTSSLQEQKHHLRAGNIVAALVMFHPNLVKRSEFQSWALENLPPSNDGMWSCLTTIIKLMAINENAETEDPEIAESFKRKTITEINEAQNAEGSSNTEYFKPLVLQLLEKYVEHFVDELI